ncbi:MAG: cytochrome c maturation protein CcmE [Methanomassiliicoccales archaeon]
MADGMVELRRKRRRRRNLVILMVVLVAAAIVLWGWSATGTSYMQVKQLTEQRAALENGTSPLSGKVIEVQGVVSAWSGGTTFVLQDMNDPTSDLFINSSASIPQGFTNGKAVVLKGVVNADVPLTMQAQGITVGCSSKY